MPVGIGQRGRTRGVQLRDLFRRQVPTDGTEILARLFLVARADDDIRNSRSLQQPVQGDLRHALAGFLGDPVERIDDAVEVFLGYRRAVVRRGVQTADLRHGLAAPEVAGEPPPAERAPDDGADLLVDAQGHELPFVLAPDQRIVGLMGDVARQSVLLGDRQRLHQVPAREVRTADVAQLAGTHEIIERAQGFLDGRLRVEAVQLEEVDIVRPESAQAPLAGLQQMMTRGADVVGSFSRAKSRLRRDDHAIAAAGDRLAQNLLGQTVRIDIGRSNMLRPASRQISTRRVAPLTSVSPHARKKSLPPPNVPVPRLNAGTFNPDPPSSLNSMAAVSFSLWCEVGARPTRQNRSTRPRHEPSDPDATSMRPLRNDSAELSWKVQRWKCRPASTDDHVADATAQTRTGPTI